MSNSSSAAVTGSFTQSCPSAFAASFSAWASSEFPIRVSATRAACFTRHSVPFQASMSVHGCSTGSSTSVTADALIAFKRALEAFPKYPVALYNLGKLSFDRCLEEQRIRGRQRQADQIHKLATEAVQYLQASLAIDPSLACAHELLYRAFGVLGDRQKASSHLSQALTLNPELRTLYDRPRLGRLPLIGRIFTKPDYPGPDFLAS